MPPTRGFALACCTACLIIGQAAPQKQLTARELFYAAAQAPAAQASAAKTANTRPAAKRSTRTPAKPVEMAHADANSPAAQAAPATAPMPANGQPPLGLRYTVQRYNRDDTTTDVPGDTVFHSGDRIRFSVEASGRGYLYIINQGSSGTWKPMFPSAEIEDGDNRVEPIRAYNMPPGNHVFTFDSTAGTENLFIVFTRQPESNLEGMIYSLQGKKKAAAAPVPEAPVESSKALIVAVNISNADVDRMRSAYSRDLLIEKVDPNTPGDRKETAVYVVNPTGSADSRVVADLHLVHQ